MRQWGKLRTGTVGISGTDYLPPIPVRKDAEGVLTAILDSATASATEKALTVFLWGAKVQLFWDGNKCTSMTAANKILVSAGAGMLTITDRHMEHFNTLLLNYYNTGEGEELKRFLYENCIQGMEV